MRWSRKLVEDERNAKSVSKSQSSQMHDREQSTDNIQNKRKPWQQRLGQQARNIYLKIADRCPGLLDANSDIDDVELDIVYYDEPALNAQLNNYGWVTQLVYKVTLKDHLSVIPQRFHAWRQSMMFIVGGGKKPGISMYPNVAKYLCGQDTSDIENGFVGAPEMAFVDGIQN